MVKASKVFLKVNLKENFDLDLLTACKMGEKMMVSKYNQTEWAHEKDWTMGKLMEQTLE